MYDKCISVQYEVIALRPITVFLVDIYVTVTTSPCDSSRHILPAITTVD